MPADLHAIPEEMKIVSKSEPKASYYDWLSPKGYAGAPKGYAGAPKGYAGAPKG